MASTNLFFKAMVGMGLKVRLLEVSVGVEDILYGRERGREDGRGRGYRKDGRGG